MMYLQSAIVKTQPLQKTDSLCILSMQKLGSLIGISRVLTLGF